ncbi:hypothetical protein CB0940_12253, partial [Cercospora beticola]
LDFIYRDFERVIVLSYNIANNNLLYKEARFSSRYYSSRSLYRRYSISSNYIIASSKD